MIDTTKQAPFSLLLPPYRQLIPLSAPRDFFRNSTGLKGTALIWNLGVPGTDFDVEVAHGRPRGVPLMVILPPMNRMSSPFDLLDIVERCRPQTILPHHPQPNLEELVFLLRRPPFDLSMEFTDYLDWRGLSIDGDTKNILRRTVELSADVRTISGLSRGVYLSRRALGRRFMSRGLPVPSHILQFCRILRAVLQLQTTNDSLFTVACALGYTDEFALSNQMYRLTGVRPSLARECLGWEWLVESWLRKESSTQGQKRATFTPPTARLEGSVPMSGKSRVRRATEYDLSVNEV